MRCLNMFSKSSLFLICYFMDLYYKLIQWLLQKSHAYSSNQRATFFKYDIPKQSLSDQVSHFIISLNKVFVIKRNLIFCIIVFITQDIIQKFKTKTQINYLRKDTLRLKHLLYQITMNDPNKSNITLKYLVVGDSGVGKTCLLMRYCQDSFQTDYLSTIGVDFKIKRMQHNARPITLNIWDTAGQERFRNITKSFYKGAHGIILTYSITDPNSYTHIQNWVDQIREAGSAETDMILVASKADLAKERKVSYKQGESLAEKYNMQFVQTSAKQDNNISSIFQILTQQVINRVGKDFFMKNKNVALEKQKKIEKKKSDCC